MNLYCNSLSFSTGFSILTHGQTCELHFVLSLTVLIFEVKTANANSSDPILAFFELYWIWPFIKNKNSSKSSRSKSNQNAALDFDRAIKWQFTKIVTVKLKTKRGARVWPSIKNRNSPKSTRSISKRNAARAFDRATETKNHKNHHGQTQNENETRAFDRDLDLIFQLKSIGNYNTKSHISSKPSVEAINMMVNMVNQVTVNAILCYFCYFWKQIPILIKQWKSNCKYNSKLIKNFKT